MYFIAKGKCLVTVRDQIEERIEYFTVHQELKEGSHFGEIALVYDCPRSATVESTNYITCASLSKEKYMDLLKIYPKIKNLFVKHIEKIYRDPVKLFLEMKLNRLSYFRKLPKHIKNEIIFNFKHKTYSSGDHIYKIGQACTDMHIIQ